jgi:hypothetical protein
MSETKFHTHTVPVSRHKKKKKKKKLNSPFWTVWKEYILFAHFLWHTAASLCSFTLNKILSKLKNWMFYLFRNLFSSHLLSEYLGTKYTQTSFTWCLGRAWKGRRIYTEDVWEEGAEDFQNLLYSLQNMKDARWVGLVACSMKDMNFMQNFGFNTWREESTWETFCIDVIH